MGATSPPTVTRGAGTSGAVGRAIRRRVSASHVVIGLAVILAFTLNYLVLQGRSETHLVAIADRSLAAGSTLEATDVRLVPIDADFAGLESLIPEWALPGYEGWILTHPLEEGEVIGVSSLIEPAAPDGLRSMSIPVPVEHAAGGALLPGDRVDVISVGGGVATYVVSDVEVLAVAERDAGALGSIGGYHLVVGVDGDQALAIAEAIDSGSLEVVRSTGAETEQNRSEDGS